MNHTTWHIENEKNKFRILGATAQQPNFISQHSAFINGFSSKSDEHIWVDEEGKEWKKK